MPYRFLADSLRLDANVPDPPTDARWPALLDQADLHSLTPLLWSVWQGYPWASRLPTQTRGRLDRALRDNESRQANVKRELVEIAALLEAARVPFIVLKGYPLAEQLYAQPAHRVIYDHDFLVPAGSAQAGHRRLMEAGYRPLPVKDEWIEKHLPSVWRNDGYHWDGYLFDPNYPRPVELHVRLWEANWRGLGLRDLPDPWPDSRVRGAAGREMRVLSDEDTLVHLAMHFAGHLVEREARLNQLLDLARFVERNPGLDWDRVLARSIAAGVGRFVYASLWLAHAVFGARLPPAQAWARMKAETPAAFRVWLAREGAQDVLHSNYRTRSRGADYALTFKAARSWKERLGILRFALAPPAAQLMAKYNVRQRWLAPLLYLRFILERLGSYARSMWRAPGKPWPS
jgi:hypothetical protein